MSIEQAAQALVAEVRSIYGHGPVPLHRPVFDGNEKRYLVDCIDSNFVSSVGQKVTDFEQSVARYVGVRHAIATVNGTAALHVALQLAGVQPGDEVLTQALTFVATCNAVRYCGAQPVFIDVDRDTLGMSPQALQKWLDANVEMRDSQPYNRTTGRRIAACLPMHTFGFPLRIEWVVQACKYFNLPVVEDAAESLGSDIARRHTGTFGKLAAMSFNGNKIITTGGGGMILTNDDALAARAKHLTTTAKLPHAYEFVHDEVGYNYRLPNLNAALGCAQMERLPEMLKIKADVAARYAEFCAHAGLNLVLPVEEEIAPNWWLNAVVLDSREDRDAFLQLTNAQGVMTRPIWRLMPRLDMYKDCQHDGLANSYWLEDRVVNLPSSVPDGALARWA